MTIAGFIGAIFAIAVGVLIVGLTAVALHKRGKWPFN